MRKVKNILRQTLHNTGGMVLLLMSLWIGIASAQGTKTVAVKVSNQTQVIKNKEYYVHVVEQGQTLFSIARAYGLKYYDAVIKTDIHLMKVGDTVWLPKNEYSVAAVSANASAVVSPSTSVHYIKIEAGQTLYSLAREYGVTVDQIIDANPELRTEQLKAGQMLKIPPKTEGGERKTSGATQRTDDVTQKTNDATHPALTGTPLQEGKANAVTESGERKAENVEKTSTAKTDIVAEKPTKIVEKEVFAEKPTKDAEKYIIAEKPTNVDETGVAVMRKPIVNPYPFDESKDFPTAQAPYYNFSTLSTFNYQVRDRQDKSRLFVTVVMPLNLSKIDGISTSKFDIEQRGKKEYKVFEFIQFYEGILMALEELKNQGIDIVLNVVDLTSDKDEDVVAAFNSHNVANSDFIVALLVKKPFQKLAELAKRHQVFVINPFSSRADIVKDNPYVVKCMPSIEGTTKGLLDIVAKKHRGGQLYILHSNSKNAVTDEKEYREELQRQLDARKDIKYTFFDWNANAKLLSTLKTTTDNVILSIYDCDKNKNTVFATTLLNRLSSLNKNVPVLMTTTNYLTEFPNVDFEQLQHLSYTTVTTGYLDYNNKKHKDFIDTYKEKFRTEPNTLYAGVAHDIMLYFSTALWRYGAEFWRNPQNFKAPLGMLFPFSLKQSSSTGGYENQYPDVYQMINYKLTPAISY
ncbi:MAG: LysM peptidoglycan-binding domain-containing protein [Bacteroidales bacterium]|nr:LysM peptidoglycan-binding domain-containing protein [Bacteroidales bacterium]